MRSLWNKLLTAAALLVILVAGRNLPDSFRKTFAPVDVLPVEAGPAEEELLGATGEPLFELEASGPEAQPAPLKSILPSADFPLVTALPEPALPETVVISETVPYELPVQHPAPLAEPEKPIRMVIRSIGLDAPIVQTKIRLVKGTDRKLYRQWRVPDKYAVGWHTGTALLGAPGNSVFNGHHNIHGEVFRRLAEVKPGDLIEIYSLNYHFSYSVTNKMILPEAIPDENQLVTNAQWILPSEDERVTLISCWPYYSNTHRVIIVARPFYYERYRQENPDQ